MVMFVCLWVTGSDAGELLFEEFIGVCLFFLHYGVG